jgi:hypothetical protein
MPALVAKPHICSLYCKIRELCSVELPRSLVSAWAGPCAGCEHARVQHNHTMAHLFSGILNPVASKTLGAVPCSRSPAQVGPRPSLHNSQQGYDTLPQ